MKDRERNKRKGEAGREEGRRVCLQAGVGVLQEIQDADGERM